MQEGADIIFAVAGPVGIGAMAAVKDNAAGLNPAPMFIGVDVDQFVSVPGNEEHHAVERPEADRQRRLRGGQGGDGGSTSRRTSTSAP